MGRGLIPDWYVHSLFNISPEEFLQYGISGLLLDIDNTLVPNYTPDADERAILFISKMLESGIKIALLSNASESRIRMFNGPLGLPAVYKAFKPFRKCYAEGLELLGLPAASVCMVGDQLFTDILGANLAGIKSLLVEPMKVDEPWYIKMKRLLERELLRGRLPKDRLK